jgi:hypothetical protein
VGRECVCVCSYVATFVLMQLCERLTVYGFGKASFQGRPVPYHYYTGTGMRHDGDPVHSFSSEEVSFLGFPART